MIFIITCTDFVCVFMQWLVYIIKIIIITDLNISFCVFDLCLPNYANSQNTPSKKLG